MKPAFVIIGEQKCGTGWLRDRLREHPQVHCHEREVNFFNDRNNHARGMDWYARQLRGPRGVHTVGEKSPDYFWIDRPSAAHFANPLEIIARDLPQARIVLCLRDPVERAISAFHHHLYQRGRRIHPALTRRHSLEQLLFDPRFDIAGRWGILSRGCYAKRLALARSLFGDRLLTLVFEEDIVAAPDQGLRRLCAHLGVDYAAGRFRLRDNAKERKPGYRELVAGYYLPAIRPLLRRLPSRRPWRIAADAAVRARLAAHYAADTAETLALLGRRAGDWPAAGGA